MVDFLVTKLIDAAHSNKLDELEYCFTLGTVDINCCNEKQITALIAACKSNNERIVERLMQFPELDVNKCAKDLKSPFFIACQKGLIKIADLLLENKNIDVNSADKTSMTPFMAAMKRREETILLKLLKRPDLDLNAQKKDGTSALMLAVQSSYSKMVKELLRRPDVDTSLTNKKGQTAEMIAEQKKNKEVLKAFNEKKMMMARKHSKFSSRAMKYQSTAERGSFLMEHSKTTGEDELKESLSKVLRGDKKLKSKTRLRRMKDEADAAAFSKQDSNAATKAKKRTLIGVWQEDDVGDLNRLLTANKDYDCQRITTQSMTQVNNALKNMQHIIVSLTTKDDLTMELLFLLTSCSLSDSTQVQVVDGLEQQILNTNLVNFLDLITPDQWAILKEKHEISGFQVHQALEHFSKVSVKTIEEAVKNIL